MGWCIGSKPVVLDRHRSSTNAGPPGELILRVLRHGSSGSLADEFVGLSEKGWSTVADEAVVQAVAPLLYRRLKDLCCLEGPDSAWTGGRGLGALMRLRDVYLHNALRNKAILAQLADVVMVLHDEGIPAIALKGAHLALFVYEDPALRPMADLDILVPAGGIARAQRTLLDRGYSSVDLSDGTTDYAGHRHLPALIRPGSIPTEIHSHIVGLGSALRIDVAGLWDRAMDGRIAEGIDLCILSPEDLLLHLCVHAAFSHQFDVPLLALCDIDAVLARHRNGIDWERFASLVNGSRTSRIAYVVLSIVADTLGSPVSPEVLQTLDHADGDRDVIRAGRDRILTRFSGLPVAYGRLSQCDRLSDRITVVRDTLFPPLRRLEKIYDLHAGSKAVLFYRFFRPFDLLIRRGRVVLQMILRVERLRPALEAEAERGVIRNWLSQVSRESQCASASQVAGFCLSA